MYLLVDLTLRIAKRYEPAHRLKRIYIYIYIYVCVDSIDMYIEST
jgi:hypothetical protein